ncbi:hypothetical protein CHCC20333_3302 [Bacillus paralicheniformis]|nr:hypothetical protein CHCC20333_3302 [Bacillus paralicheniformis]
MILWTENKLMNEYFVSQMTKMFLNYFFTPIIGFKRMREG